MAFLKTICGVYQKRKYYNFILYNSVVFLLMSLVTSLNLPFLYIMSFSYYTGYAILFNQKMCIRDRTEGVHNVGDVMCDAVLYYSKMLRCV